MGLLGVTVMLVPLFLTSTGLQTEGHQGLCTEEPFSTLHMTFDPRKMRLSWDCRENATVVQCAMIHKTQGEISMETLGNPCECTFTDYTLHLGVMFVVNVNISQTLCQEQLFYNNSGGNGTAAENFSCFISDNDFMNCSWTRGREAPDDVQYFLYIRDPEGKVERECPHYIKDSGTHVGCYVEDLSGIPFDIYFLVNGTSQAVGIQFFDNISSQDEIKRYNPPVNITATCNHTHCVLTWEWPRKQHHMSVLEQIYELDIQQKGSKNSNRNNPIYVSASWGNKHNFPINPRARYIVRIRTAKSRISIWGPWSEPVGFGFDNQEVSPAYIYLLVVLGTVLGTLVIGFLCKRFLVIQSLFPRIPKIKDKLSDSQQTNQQINWGALMPAAGKAENEEVLKVEDVD